MSDELPVEDGAVDTPNPVDYEKRWKDTHANWNTLNEQMTRFKSDPNAIIEFIQETHPDLLAGDEDEEEDPDFSGVDEDDDPVAPLNSRLDKFEQWQQQVENERGQARFNTDLQAELGDEKVPAKVTDWIKDRTAALGNNSKALKQAVAEYREFAGEIRGPSRKPTPTPPQPGTAATEDYNASKDPNARRAARRARIAAQVEAGMQQQ